MTNTHLCHTCNKELLTLYETLFKYFIIFLILENTVIGLK